MGAFWLPRRTAAVLATVTAMMAAVLIGATPAQAATCQGGYFQVVAHEDDDLLFQSPNLQKSADTGRCLQSIYLTAGDAGYGQNYWGSRETGLEVAYAQMLGVSNSWTTSNVNFGSGSVRVRTLNARPNVALIFMRLPDGGVVGGGFSMYGYQSLEKLLWGSIGSISAVDGSASYSASGLRSALTSMMNTYLPNDIKALDYTGSYTDGDHSDHHAAGYLTYDASSAYSHGHYLGAYLGYKSTSYPANVSGSDLSRKTDVYYAYSNYDDEITHGSQDSAWLQRQYIARIDTRGTPIFANAGADQTTSAGGSVTLNASGSSGSGLSYSWSQTSGPSVSLSGANSATPTFTPTQAGTYTFTVTVSSGSSSATDSVDVIVRASDTNNVARSGATATASAESTSTSQTAAKAIDGVVAGYPADSSKEWAAPGGRSGTWIQLNWAPTSPVTVGSVTLYDRPNSNDQILGGTLTFSDGTTVPVPALDNSGAGTEISFPARSTSSIRLTVTSVSSSTQNVGLAEFQVWGSSGPPPPNQAPTASAVTPVSGDVGSLATLNGSASSDPEGAALTYAWTAAATNPAAVSLSSTTVSSPTFTPSLPGTYQFTLTVNDGSGAANAIASTTVTVNVSAALTNLSRLPSAAATASSQNTATGQTAAKAIDGAATGYPTDSSKEWATAGGKAGSWLTVTFPSASVSKVVLYDRPNSNDQVTGGTLTFSDGSTVSVPSLNNNGAATTVTFPARTATNVKFTVNTVSSSTQNVGLAEMEVFGTTGPAAPNQAPTANAVTPVAGTTGTMVTLNGSASTDPEGAALTYAWTPAATNQPAVTLSSSTTAMPTFVPSQPGTYQFTLTVNDGSGAANATASTTVTVNVVAGAPQPNQAPTASAISPVSGSVGSTVTLNGSASSDPEGAALSYAWTTAGNNPAPVLLSSATVASPTFTPSAAGTYQFTLTVNDGSGAPNATSSTTVTVNVSAASSAEVNVARLSSAVASASSENTSTGQTAAKAIDGAATGYPDNYTKEWATVRGKVGSWLKVTFPSASVSKVVLYDRPNSNDRVTGGTLTFSDGSTVSVGSLNNTGGATTVTFSARTVTSVTFTVDTVSSSTENVGLAEFEIWGTP